MTLFEPPKVHAPGVGLAVMARLDELALISSDPGASTRLYLTREHKAAAMLVQSWMEQAGMTAHRDAAGSVVGRYPGTGENTKTLIIGSHIDTIRDAGRFDGNLGVVVGIAAVAQLAARQIRLPFAIEVVAFGDEEGVRFPVTLTGSRALAGTFDPATLDAADESDLTLRSALTAFGCDPQAVQGLARRREDTLGYVEVHIEQGPVLERENLPVGVVTAINGATRVQVTVEGEAGHAGTVPMRYRHDAFLAAAEMALEIERIALATAHLVATVGSVEVRPGVVNVIPARAAFTIDVRSSHDAARRDALAALERACGGIAVRRGVRIAMVPTYDEPAAPCAPFIMDALARAVETLGLPALRLPSGAGHDGLAMATLCPIGMLFVRCAGGISHNPAELVTANDAGLAVAALVAFLHELAAMPEPAGD